jgi:hypothetical protein
VHSLRFSERERQAVARIRELADAGQDDAAIAAQLNRDGFFPCRSAGFTPQIVLKLRCRHQVWLGLGKLRRGHRPSGYTIREMARLIGIDPSWIYRGIGRGTIAIERDKTYGCYLFPRTREAVRRMKQLKQGLMLQVSFRKEHCDG